MVYIIIVWLIGCIMAVDIGNDCIRNEQYHNHNHNESQALNDLDEIDDQIYLSLKTEITTINEFYKINLSKNKATNRIYTYYQQLGTFCKDIESLWRKYKRQRRSKDRIRK